MLVNEIMVKNIFSIKKKDNLMDAFMLMMKHGIRHLPVLEKKKVIGVLTDRDVRQSIKSWPDDPAESELFRKDNTTLVEEVMIDKVYVVHEKTSVEECAHIMQVHKIGCLPILEKGKLVGIITKSDIIDVFISMMEYLQESSRIDIVLDDNPEEFANVEKLIKDNGGDIIGVGISPGRKKKQHVNFFRIKKCNADLIAAAIKAAGYKVVSVLG